MASSADVYGSVIPLLFINIGSVFCLNDTEFTSTVGTLPVPFQNSSDTSAEHHLSSLNFTSLHSLETDDSGQIAGIVIGALTGTLLIVGLLLCTAHRYFMRKNMTSLNFDNPVYRKTTEDQFSLEKNQYHPARSYPSSLEPLTSPGTNEFV